MNDEVLTAKEAAKMLKLPKRTLEYFVATNQVPYSRLGKRSVRFSRRRLMEHLREREGVAYHRPGKRD